jgi:hypothetical protein
MRARDRRGAILEKGAIREGCHTTRRIARTYYVTIKKYRIRESYIINLHVRMRLIILEVISKVFIIYASRLYYLVLEVLEDYLTIFSQ